jgi:hypothetical protein
MPSWLKFVVFGVTPAVLAVRYIRKAIRTGVAEDEIWDIYRVESPRLFWLVIYSVGTFTAGWVMLLVYLIYWLAPQP